MREDFEKIIGGKKYDTEKVDVIASKKYWGGSNLERSGRNTYLYKTKKGNYFIGHLSCWLITKAEAMVLYEKLPDHEMEYEVAFGVEAEEAESKVLS